MNLAVVLVTTSFIKMLKSNGPIYLLSTPDKVGFTLNRCLLRSTDCLLYVMYDSNILKAWPLISYFVSSVQALIACECALGPHGRGVELSPAKSL